MTFLFNFALRLFLAFLAVKLVLGPLGGGSPALLLVSALVLAGLTYLVGWLASYYQRTWQGRVAELGWRLARFLIGLNKIHGQGKQGTAPTAKSPPGKTS